MRYPLDKWRESLNTSNMFGATSPDMYQYYPQTLTHIGCDHAVPKGTPIYAPCDGEIVVVSDSIPKGYVGIFSFNHMGTDYGWEMCHLSELPKLGKYKEGEQIAITGNTGKFTTGAHLHSVLHRDCKVTKNYQELSSVPKGQPGRDKFLQMVVDGKLINPHDFFIEKTAAPINPPKQAEPITQPATHQCCCKYK